MPRQPTQSRLSEHDIELILGVLRYAWRKGWPVARVIEQRLTQNSTALEICIEDGDADGARTITAETKRILRLQQRFASWRAAEAAAVGSRIETPTTPHRDHAAKA